MGAALAPLRARPRLVPPREVAGLLEWAAEQDVVRVDLKIGDLSGRLRHISLPVHKLADALEHGVGFAGSHYGFSGPVGEDMVMIPDPATAWADPFLEVPAVSFLAQPLRAGSAERFDRDPRAVAERAEAQLRATGIAGASRWLPELEFYVMPEGALDGRGGARLPSGRDSYHASPPRDRHAGFRARAVELLEAAGMRVKYDHHETGARGQMEIELDFGGLVASADAVLLAKYIVRNLAAAEGLEAVFLPKPFADAAGNGLHVHVQLLADGRPLFAGDGYAGLSPTALSFIAGILDHLGSLAAFTNPSTNSYRRLVPGMEAPIKAGFAVANRAAAIRIPGYAVDATHRRFEYRPLDATANPYLAFAALLMAGIDGVKRELDPVRLGYGPLDADAAVEPPQSFPRTLDDALDALEADSAYLREGDVFPRMLIDEWLELKRRESKALELQPHPAEFEMYADV
jgi:glutamine synthetase